MCGVAALVLKTSPCKSGEGSIPLSSAVEWRSSVSRQAHNLEVAGSNPASATSNYLWQLLIKVSVIEPTYVNQLPIFLLSSVGRASSC